MGSAKLSDPTFIANNEPFFVVPNSIEFGEGLGEQKIEPQTLGGGVTEGVFVDNAETAVGKLKISLYSTAEAIAAARQWKVNGASNLFQLTATTAQGDNFNRSFPNAAVVNDYTVQLQADGVLELEIESDPPI